MLAATLFLTSLAYSGDDDPPPFEEVRRRVEPIQRQRDDLEASRQQQGNAGQPSATTAPDPTELARLNATRAGIDTDRLGDQRAADGIALGETREAMEERRAQAVATNRRIETQKSSLRGEPLQNFLQREYAAPHFPQITNGVFNQNFPRIIQRIDQAIERTATLEQRSNYDAMGNYMTSMQLAQQVGQLGKTINDLDSVSPNTSTRSNPIVNNQPQGALPSGNLTFGSSTPEEKNTRAGSTTKSGEVNDLVATSDGRPSQGSKFMAGIGDMKDVDLDKAIGISSIVPPDFLANLDKKLAGIENEKDLVDLLKKMGVDANIASLAGIKSLSEFGAIAGKAIEVKAAEDGASYSGSGGAGRGQGSAPDDLNPNDILLQLTQGIGRMNQVQEGSAKANEFRATREMLASNLDARLKLASKEAGSSKIAVNPNAPDSRNPAQANCLPGENCAASRAPSSSNSLSNLIFLAFGIIVSFGIILWVRRSKNKA
jgi:hypothetical protein